jgi:hypothetical protein
MKRLIFLAIAALVAVAAYAQYAETLSIRFTSAARYAEVEAAIVAHYGYQTTVQTGTQEDGTPIMAPNPETRKTFVRRQIKAWLMEHRTAYIRNLATSTALAAVPVSDEPDTP